VSPYNTFFHCNQLIQKQVKYHLKYASKAIGF